MKKTLKIFAMMIIAILVLTTSVFAASFIISANVQKNEKEYTVTLMLDKIIADVQGINVFSTNFEYDKEVFEEIKKADITSKNDWNDVTYNEETGKMLLFRSDFTNESNKPIIEIKLKQKENVSKNKTEIKFLKTQATDSKADLRADDITVNINLNSDNTLIKNIIIYIAVALILLLLLRIIIKAFTKRRKVR